MRWDRDHRSDDVIDRRGQGGGIRGMGGIAPLFGLLFRFKWGWLIALGLLAAMYFGGNLCTGGDASRAHGPAAPRSDDEAAAFAGFVLDDVQRTWDQRFASRGDSYPHAKLVLFTDATDTGCGYGDAATGPFYCPNDQRVYIDLGFFRELSERFGAPGDFAQAYVIGHEVGHHVQNLLGTMKSVHRQADQTGPQSGSVRLELQADCYAGIWAKATERRELLGAGDIAEGMAAAAAVGDDRLQRMGRGKVSPEKWTHGSSEQRVRWFQRGYADGALEACDTFAAGAL
jgi:uncharacterized protein